MAASTSPSRFTRTLQRRTCSRSVGERNEGTAAALAQALARAAPARVNTQQQLPLRQKEPLERHQLDRRHANVKHGALIQHHHLPTAQHQRAISIYLSTPTPSTNVSATTATRSVSQSSTMQDWRMYLTIEERQAVRSKIRDAYTSRCTTYEDLLQVACAIEEELLHISAPSRLDYFKSGFEFENRVKLKKDQLQGQLAALDAKRRSSGGQQQQQQPQQGSNSSGNSGSKAVGSAKKQRN
ncbi:hypothetical protein ON010_g16892 [Phytophthora cinnamomi]|nr:hypothetical protein ON010_g16892 [Phytophthora cinnamomi]